MNIEPAAQGSAQRKALVIATAIAIDAVFKESGNRTVVGELAD